MTEPAVERRDVGPRAAARVLRSRNFWPYFLGNATSASGTWFQNLAAALLVYRLTHSAFLLGVLNFAQFLPVLVLSPWAGTLADRVDRKQLLLVTQVIAAGLSATLALLAWSGVGAATVIAFSFAIGITSAFSAPASQALIVQLVRHDDVPQAVALNSMTYNLARALGPAGAAGAIAWLGIPPAFLLNALSYVLFVGALLAVRPRAQERAPSASLLESFALLRREPQLAAFLLIVMAVGFASDPINTEAPAFAEAFGHADTLAGAIIGVFGAGAVTAAFVVAGRVAGSRGRMAVTLTLLGGGVIGFSLSPWPAARVRSAVRRRYRLPRVEHGCDDEAAARRPRDAARSDHGAVVDRLPRTPADRVACRRCACRNLRRPDGRRRPRRSCARGRGHDHARNSR